MSHKTPDLGQCVRCRDDVVFPANITASAAETTTCSCQHHRVRGRDDVVFPAKITAAPPRKTAAMRAVAGPHAEDTSFLAPGDKEKQRGTRDSEAQGGIRRDKER